VPSARSTPGVCVWLKSPNVIVPATPALSARR
jgi:hypothetical protein